MLQALKWQRYWLALFGLILVWVGNSAYGAEMATLAAKKDLTPESLLRSFARFEFELGVEPQDPDVFLQRRRGDCDDFAQLASRLLTERGYQTKMVVVMMEQQTHVVCYVREIHGYLDFNRRAEPQPVVATDGSLEDIAQKVAVAFHSKWHMASEIRYENKLPRYLDSVFPPSRPPKKAMSVASSRGGISRRSRRLCPHPAAGFYPGGCSCNRTQRNRMAGMAGGRPVTAC